mmetsp:Transcript_10802/g.23723  ORF Transcript_10802/g.23723 Transcript_10802/m.23723 type:complete len:141 (-) Transcript_10802:856-1278(-)
MFCFNTYHVWRKAVVNATDCWCPHHTFKHITERTAACSKMSNRTIDIAEKRPLDAHTEEETGGVRNSGTIQTKRVRDGNGAPDYRVKGALPPFLPKELNHHICTEAKSDKKKTTWRQRPIGLNVAVSVPYTLCYFVHYAP